MLCRVGLILTSKCRAGWKATVVGVFGLVLPAGAALAGARVPDGGSDPLRHLLPLSSLLPSSLFVLVKGGLIVSVGV